MTNFIPAINTLVAYGLKVNISTNTVDRNRLLEKSLVKIYNFYCEQSNVNTPMNIQQSTRYHYSAVRENIASNFPDFSYYKTIINPLDIYSTTKDSIGDSIDDLTDTILDLLEIKHQIESYGLEEGIRYFHFIFQKHTLKHILNLLNYLSQKD